MKPAKLKPVSNKYLTKAANKGKNFQPSPQVTARQPVSIKKTNFVSQKGV
jgi:hypothetical protein